MGLISILYILPILPKQNRLRDLNFIKIFLIAIVWSYLGLWTLVDQAISKDIIPIILIERFLFILALTLPFDIRDQDIDHKMGVKTIPNSLGRKLSIRLIYFLIFLSALCWTYIRMIEYVPITNFLTGAILILALSALLISYCLKHKSDYFYSGGVDGIILIRSLGFILLAMVQ